MQITILDILSLIGSLGLFIYGMRVMSEALQKVAGMRMRHTLAAITSNKFKSILTGLVITSTIQSSSATTIMIVSFVNAGLLSLCESLGVIMGANIGTTVTAWLVSLLGFKFNINILTLPLIGLGFPLLFSSNSLRKYWGEFIIGFALIFISLNFLKESFPDISANPEIISFISNYTHLGFLSTLIFLFTGLIITALVQSSSVAITLTLVMCYKGWISFELAAAMILGENIGTTITANIAAIVGNKMAKRAALSHFLFNLVGLIWILPLLKFFLLGINNILLEFNMDSPFENVNSIPLSLSIFHSLFNIINTILFVWFIPVIASFATRLIPDNGQGEESFSLKFLSSGILSTSELSILQARKEIANYAKRVTKMFGLVQKLFAETNDNEFDKISNAINEYEKYSDRIEIEIAGYLTKISEGELSEEGSRRIRTMLKIVDDLESISDSCYNLNRVLKRKRKEKIWFTQDIRNNVNRMFKLIVEALREMNNSLNSDYKKIHPEHARIIEKQINKLRNELKKDHLNNIENKNYKYQAGVIYNDIFSHCERMGDYVVNITETIAGINTKT